MAFSLPQPHRSIDAADKWSDQLKLSEKSFYLKHINESFEIFRLKISRSDLKLQLIRSFHTLNLIFQSLRK